MIPHVFLIDASTQQSIHAAFALIASAARIEASIEAVLNWLASHDEQRFLIFKNFDDTSLDSQAYIPANNRGKILVTTKHPANRRWATNEAHFIGKCHYQVSEMEFGEAVELLLRTAQIQASAVEVEYAGAVVMVSNTLCSGFCVRRLRTRAGTRFTRPIHRARRPIRHLR